MKALKDSTLPPRTGIARMIPSWEYRHLKFAYRLRFAGGAIGTFHAGYELIGSQAGYVGPSYDTFLALRGTHGFARLPLSDGNAYTLVSEAAGWSSGGRRERRFDLPPSSAYGGVAGEEFVRQFLREARAGTPALCPIEAVVHMLDVIEAALQSSETGRSVRLDKSGQESQRASSPPDD